MAFRVGGVSAGADADQRGPMFHSYQPPMRRKGSIEDHRSAATLYPLQEFEDRRSRVVQAVQPLQRMRSHDARGRVQVAVRVRPPIPEETFGSGDSTLEVSGNDVRVRLPALNASKDFILDKVFTPNSTQREVCSFTQDLINSVQFGTNCTVLCYGQTGSGKTHTMGLLNSIADDSQGVVPFALQRFCGPNKNGKEQSISIECIQQHLDAVHDLLAVESTRAPLPVRELPGGEIVVEGVTRVQVSCYSDAAALINEAMGRRSMAMSGELAGHLSSRSHCLLTVRPEMQDGQQSGRLVLVDLAGSERTRSTTGARMDEARAINASLAALGNVVAALAKSESHVPYRDSKLTRLLQDCIGMGSRTVLIACVHPGEEQVSETLSTLTFAQRCRRVPVMLRRGETRRNQIADAGVGDIDALFAQWERRKHEEMERMKHSYEDEMNRLRSEVHDLQRARAESPGLVGVGSGESLAVSRKGKGDGALHLDWCVSVMRLVLSECQSGAGGGLEKEGLPNFMATAPHDSHATREINDLGARIVDEIRYLQHLNLLRERQSEDLLHRAADALRSTPLKSDRRAGSEERPTQKKVAGVGQNSAMATLTSHGASGTHGSTSKARRAACAKQQSPGRRQHVANDVVPGSLGEVFLPLNVLDSPRRRANPPNSATGAAGKTKVVTSKPFV